MSVDNKLHLLGYATGLGGRDQSTGEGPQVIKQSPYLNDLIKKGFPIQWETMIHSPSSPALRLDETIQQSTENLAKTVSTLLRQKQFFCLIGGDHSAAIGTWSGAYDAFYDQGEIGLIWIDAHLDSHTPETSESGRIHGMPLACLLGYGFPTLTSILHNTPKLNPENVCLIGARSFEQGEAALLKRLNVRIYFMEEIKQRGFKTILFEAVSQVKANTIGYGISLDIDSLDPTESPGTDVPEPDGIHTKDLLDGLSYVLSDSKLVGMEIVEFDPKRDTDHMTEKLIVNLLATLVNSRLKTYS